jgi:hypothetical protein
MKIIIFLHKVNFFFFLIITYKIYTHYIKNVSFSILVNFYEFLNWGYHNFIKL